MRKCSLWGICLLSLAFLWSCERIVMPQIPGEDDDTAVVDGDDDNHDDADGGDDDSGSDSGDDSDTGTSEDPDVPDAPEDPSDSGDTDVPSDPDIADDDEGDDDGEGGGAGDSGDDSSDDTDVFHEGVEDDPYTYRDLNESFIYDMVMNDGATIHESWVVGYIVGYIDGNKLTESSAVFSYGDVETNILLADSPDVKDYAKCVPVQLSKSGSYADVRYALNLKNNTDVMGRRVKIRGAVTKYMGVPGLKNAIKYKFVE